MTLDNVTEGADVNLNEITLDNADSTINASLEEITFDEFTLEDADSTINASLEEITFDDVTTTSGERSSDQEINLDDLGFEEINNSSDEQSNDLNNISEWLDSLETPNQDRDNIADWLDTLDKDSLRANPNPAQENLNQETTNDLSKDTDDISFQFLEDLLDRDADNNRNN
ncbi:MAG: hypothetical protein HC930_09435 [Hydrococcus sp. SU_1_0]|nr:hypothetical protein [Hydrococcus sp. SU_1_0]